MKVFHIVGTSGKDYLVTSDSAYKANQYVRKEELKLKYAKMFNSGNYNSINSLLSAKLT